MFILVFLLTTSAQSQNSGYLGKHFSLNYNLYTSQAITGPSEHGGKGWLSFNTNHHFFLDAAVARSLSIGLSFAYVHTNFSYENTLSDYYLLADGHGGFSLQHVSLRSNSVGNMDVYGIGIYQRIFFKGSIAPLGTYIKPELMIQLIKPSAGNPVYLFAPAEYTGPEFVDPGTVVNYALMIDFGQNRLLFNRMFIDYGFRIGLSPRHFASKNTVYGETNYLERASLERMGRHLLFNVKLGIGVLLF